MKVVSYPTEEKVWGCVRHVFSSDQCAVSILEVEKGSYCSKHYHRERVNRFIVQSGVIAVVWYPISGSVRRRRLKAGDVFDVPAGVIHRFEVIKSGVVVEVYFPSATVRQDDIVRLDLGGKL